MKYLFLFLPLFSLAQTASVQPFVLELDEKPITDSKGGISDVYIGTGYGRFNTFEVATYLEYKLDFLVLQAGPVYKEEALFIVMKVGGGIKWRNWNWRVYAPYFNYKIGEGYNVPFSTEIFYQDKLSICVDIYSDGVIPILRARLPLGLK